MFEFICVNGNVYRFNRETGESWCLILDTWVKTKED